MRTRPTRQLKNEFAIFLLVIALLWMFAPSLSPRSWRRTRITAPIWRNEAETETREILTPHHSPPHHFPAFSRTLKCYQAPTWFWVACKQTFLKRCCLNVWLRVLFSSYFLLSPKLSTLPCLQTGVLAYKRGLHFVAAGPDCNNDWRLIKWKGTNSLVAWQTIDDYLEHGQLKMTLSKFIVSN